MRLSWPSKYLGCRSVWPALAACTAAIFAAAPVRALSADGVEPRQGEHVDAITDLSQQWELSPEMNSVAHPLRIEGRVTVFDPAWKNAWIEKDGLSLYVRLASSPPAMQVGQHVLIEGSFIPARGLDAASVTVKVLPGNGPIVPTDAKGKIGDGDSLHGRIVSMEAYVDGQQLMDDEHLRLALVAEDQPVIGWLKPDNPRSIPDWQGHVVRLVGLYSDRFDATGTDRTVELWISRQNDLTVLGSLADDPRFEQVVTPINQIYRIPVAKEVHVRGEVQTQGPGSTIVIRDKTGEVLVRSAQQQRFPYGTEVEAIGRVETAESQWILGSALYRRVPSGTSAPSPLKGPSALESVDQVRQLTPEEAARGHRVRISGTVVWALPEFDFFFVQDVTGGIRVRYPRGRMEPPRLTQYIEIEGLTYSSGFASAVDLQRFKNLGSMTAPPAKPVAFEQAITGREDGQWVQMRGFFRRTESKGDQRQIYVTTPAGEFVACLDSPVDLSATPGSLIRVSGACETLTDGGGHTTGLRLWVPFLHSITVDEKAPDDLFDLPLRPIRSLGLISAARDLIRVRVAGVVLHAVPGWVVYIQDDQAGLLLFSRGTESLVAGDSIEAVGILGREGTRTVLREAVIHRVTSGPSPEPIRISDPSRFLSDFDARLVKIRGTLIDVLRQSQHTRLTLQNGYALFEAVLDQRPGSPAPVGLDQGAVLEVTGIYRAAFDDTRQLRGFQLRLRSPADVVVVHGPHLWTVKRALWAAVILGFASLLGIGWVAVLRRQVRGQTEQIRGQLERQVQLEAEVQRAARLESLGVLAGGIAHDFNNLLTVVIGNLSLAMFDEKAAASVGGLLREIERAAFRARDLTQQLLTFAKGGNPVRATVALPEIVREAAESMLHGSSARCAYDVEPGLWSANVDKDQITQTIQNLTLNAVEAMPGGGVVRISLANEEIAPGAHHSLAAGRYVRVAIADSGQGIKPEVLSRVFDPYFTTKKAGGGLGLATVYSIVKRHDGRIEVQSTPGHGATFTLWLPAGEAKALPPPEAPAAVPTGMPPATARVLFMDDEESVRRLGETLIRRMGLTAVTVADGGAAVSEFRAAQAAGQPYDLVILDLTIPGGMGGREAMEHIRKLDPGVPAIVSSGYSNDPVLAEFARFGFQAIVPKPYEVNELMETVKRLLVRRS